MRGARGEHAVADDDRVRHGGAIPELPLHQRYGSRASSRCVAFVALERVDAGAAQSESERNNRFARPPATAGPLARSRPAQSPCGAGVGIRNRGSKQVVPKDMRTVTVPTK